MDLTRRSFIKATATAAAMAAAGGSLAAMAGCSNGDSAVTPGSGDHPTDSEGATVYTGVCRYCGTGCGVLIHAKDGQLLSVTGDPDNLTSRGLNCVKGYYLARMLRGEARLTVPLIRDDPKTKGSMEGMHEATWEEALDLVADKLKTAWKNDKSRIGFWGSGQQPIGEGYLTSKFWKAGLLSNNIDPNARMCMASAVVGFMNVFQTDEPAGCYDDIENADLILTWGANMAECHPVLYSRVTAHKVQDENCKHYDITTMRTRTSETADKVMIFKPGTDLAITNCIANYLCEHDKVDHDFIKDHITFKKGTENIGYPFADDYDVTEPGNTVDAVEEITFEEYAEKLKPYTIEYTSKLSGVSEEDLTTLCEAFANPDLKIASWWTMGVNQHYRGTWVNHNLHNLHLISGHFGKPGDGGFSLTGQPSACGTAREVGTFCHRLPADLVVANPAHRRYTEAIWDLPEGYLDAIEKPGMHTIKMFRTMSRGGLDFLWSAHNNWAQSLPNAERFLGLSGKEEDQGIFNTFIAVNEIYPTLTTKYADVVFPVAAWAEKEGQFGNGERRTSVFEKAIDPPGDARWDVWVLMQIAQRVLDGETIDGKDAMDHLFGFIWDKEKGDFKAETQRDINRDIWEEYRTFSNPSMNEKAEKINHDENLHMEAKQLAPYDEYLKQHGITWPVREVDGQWVATKWRFAYGDGKQENGFDVVGIDQYGSKDLAGGVSFYKSAGQRASVVFRPYEEPPYTPDKEYPFWLSTGRLLEHWHTGSMTRQVPELNRAVPEAYCYMNKDDAKKLGLQDGDNAKITSKYGSFEATVNTGGRFDPPDGMVFVPFFAEETLVNRAVMDVYCPLSKEVDFKKTTCKIEKA
ncbi:MAG: twin-arginine translocation signal domain-containing protein [Coriobacteriaceae bacterium]|nr:twin-arginine translocation signal domain-containing protein [Coriobacteriaceae bacterium]